MAKKLLVKKYSWGGFLAQVTNPNVWGQNGAAEGASGVAGGSLLLIPVACSLFGISNDIAMEVVGIGFIVGVVQDSCETALNSSTDVLFTAVAEKSVWGKGKANQ